MSRIRAKHTKPELIVAKLLRDLKLPFLSHPADLPGTPDFFLPAHNLVIEVYGCFWHKHNCKFFILPKTNPKFWELKLDGNTKRDKKNKKLLTQSGYRVCTIWECQIRNGYFFEKLINCL